MADLAFIGLTLLLFALSMGFIAICERMLEEQP
jgi:hypothetical protein